MLRPFEFLRLRASDILVPSTSLTLASAAFVYVGAPKMRRLGARREHARVDEPEVVELLEAYLPLLSPEAPVFPGGSAMFRKQLAALMSFFGIPSVEPDGITPASLRPGGATYLYRCTDSPEKVRYRGRWMSARMLEIYIQETAASRLLTGLSSEQRARIVRFAAQAPQLMRMLTASLSRARQ